MGTFIITNGGMFHIDGDGWRMMTNEGDIPIITNCNGGDDGY